MNAKGNKRAIPKASMIDVELTNTGSSSIIPPQDLALIVSLREELQSSGLIERERETMRGIESGAALDDVLRDAESKSLSEQELNPDYHNPRLDEALMGRSGTSNPLMEKFDDYEGVDYNPAFRARSKMQSAKRNSKKRRTL